MAAPNNQTDQIFLIDPKKLMKKRQCGENTLMKTAPIGQIDQIFMIDQKTNKKTGNAAKILW